MDTTCDWWTHTSNPLSLSGMSLLHSLSMTDDIDDLEMITRRGTLSLYVLSLFSDLG